MEFYSGILLPGMVNAHCHLELSCLRGAIPAGGGFAAFARGMGAQRGRFDEEQRRRAIEAADIATPASFREELLNEIMKEFWGEGQIFATYKRFNLPMEGVNGKEHPATDDTYLLPLPESEESAGID